MNESMSRQILERLQSGFHPRSLRIGKDVDQVRVQSIEIPLVIDRSVFPIIPDCLILNVYKKEANFIKAANPDLYGKK
jgi:hypothetical protein